MNAFWEEKTLAQMTPQEWESVCDGCGLCCLVTLQDEDDGSLAYTNIACRLLDSKTCRCTKYNDRKRLVPDCTSLSLENVNEFDWLPDSCAYRLLANGDPLPEWHHLRAGNKSKMHRKGYSVKNKVIPETLIDPDDYEDHIVRWVSNSKS